MIGDHCHVSDGKAVVGSGGRVGTRPTCFLPDQAYVMAKMRLQINTAAPDLEKVSSLVFRHCVATLRTAQAALNRGLSCIGTRRRSLCDAQRQQGRCNHQQECSLHGILQRFSPCGGRKFRLGFVSASDSGVEPS